MRSAQLLTLNELGTYLESEEMVHDVCGWVSQGGNDTAVGVFTSLWGILSCVGSQ